jgi:hypothetical protein
MSPLSFALRAGGAIPLMLAAVAQAAPVPALTNATGTVTVPALRA